MLARIPTPLHRLERLSGALGADVWVKRDDLTGFGLSGNKIRKLDLLLDDARSRRATDVLTTGGIQSNHCRATAIACRQQGGLEPHLLLRGTPQAPPESNLLLDRLVGAEVRWCTADDYRERRDELLAQWAEELAAAGRVPYVIPEGGSNALGALAFSRAAEEVERTFDHVVCAVGSGGTVGGLALRPQLGFVHGVAVCDDESTFRARVEALTDDPCLDALPAYGESWEILDGYQGPAYAVATPEIWQTIAWVARLEGLILDPVYTGKAMHALVSEVRAGRWGGQVLFWHTGGGFGVFGRGAEIEEALP